MFAVLSLKNTSAVSLKLKIPFQKYGGYDILNRTVICTIYEYKLQYYVPLLKCCEMFHLLICFCTLEKRSIDLLWETL